MLCMISASLWRHVFPVKLIRSQVADDTEGDPMQHARAHHATRLTQTLLLSSVSSSPPRFPELPVLNGAARTGRFFIPSTRGWTVVGPRTRRRRRRNRWCNIAGRNCVSSEGAREGGGQRAGEWTDATRTDGRTDADGGRSGSRRTLRKKRTGE